MLNASDNLPELICPVRRSHVASFPSLRRCFSGYAPLVLLLHPPGPQPPRLRSWADALAFFAVFFFFFISLFVARLLVLRSVKTHHIPSADSDETEDGDDDGHWFSRSCGGDENMIKREEEALRSLPAKVTDEDATIGWQSKDGAKFSLSAMDCLPPERSGEDDEATGCSIADQLQNDSTAEPLAHVQAFFPAEERKHYDEGKRFSEDDDDEIIVADEKKDGDEEGDPTGYESSTISSTSKSSGELRSSANLTENLFSSSSRRHSSKWESYVVFRKYEEEMTFLDRFSFQKLSDADSLRMIRTHPASMSKRITRTLTAKERYTSNFKLAHQELEVAYVAQICLTWEALRWNYILFQQRIDRDRGSGSGGGGGCCFSARTAQEFQQFQVLLQRFIENEPFEKGPRPVVYARTRIVSPKLLQVPEIKRADSEKGNGTLVEESTVSADEFRAVLAECISTFSGFLKVDRESQWELFRALLKQSVNCGGGETLTHVLIKENKRNKRQLKAYLRRGTCPLLKGARRPRRKENMEMLIGLVDMMIASRALRMPNLCEEQLQWCREKMSRVKIGEGQVRLDSSPLFFPVN